MKRLKRLSNKEATLKAHQIRHEVVRVALKNGAGHIAPSLSSVDILAALYYRVMNLGGDPLWPDRDRLIFSKAHGCYGVYTVLADLGYLRGEDWETFYNGSSLCGCIERDVERGIEASCGSLGHGLPLAVGLAFGARLQNKRHRVYCITGDGELQEGSNWEAIQFAVKHRLSNLTLVIDRNGLQAMDFIDRVLVPEGKKHDLRDKMKVFGFVTRECDGHDVRRISSVIIDWARNEAKLGAPQALVANTTKGYGLLCMEDIAKFHFRLPTEDELAMGNRYECHCTKL